MKTISRNLFFVLCCFFWGFLASALEPPTLVLSEIQFLPATQNGIVKIELYNCSDKDVAFSGWFLIDQDMNKYTFPDMPPIPPGAFIVVSFGQGAEKGKDDKSFINNVALLHCTESWANNSFRGMENECALFAVRNGEVKIKDFVRWGRRSRTDSIEPSAAQSQAIKAKMWKSGLAVYVGKDLRPGDPPPIAPGGSIARKTFECKSFINQEWGIVIPADVSMGSINLCQTPYLVFPHQKLRLSLEGKLRFTWEGTLRKGCTFHIQVASNSSFEKLVIEEETTSCFLEKEISAGKYFWRARVKSQESIGKWSEPVEFEIRAEKK
jgi:hypothetical protein